MTPSMMLPQDPRLRLLTAFGAVLLVSQIGGLVTALSALAAAAALTLAQPQRPGWRRLVHLEGFLILLFVSLPFTVPGAPVAALGPLTVSAEGLLLAATLGAKVSASVLVLTLLLGGLEPARLGAALAALRVPETLVRLFVATARYRVLIGDEARRLGEAMRARGFTPRSDRHTLRTYGWLIGMLLVRALERAERVEEAMRCRGYTGRIPRLAAPRPAARDIAAAGLIVASAAALLMVDRL